MRSTLLGSKFCFRRNTFFHKKLEAGYIEPKIVVKYTTLPDQQEMSTLCRIARLTRVVLDLRVFSQGDIPGCTVLSLPDRPEVALARQTFYE